VPSGCSGTNRMADYKTHITTSGILGVGYGFGLWGLDQMTPVQAALAGCLTGVAGMLPDIDSQSGRPVRELFNVTAAAAPLVLFDRLIEWAEDMEGAMLLAVLVYLCIRYGASLILGLCSVHRGMFHSIPALLISAEVTYLAYGSPSIRIRLLMACGVALGFLSHLVLDEIYSVAWHGGVLKLKSSAGSAVKFFSRSWGAVVFCYGLLFTLTYAVWVDGGLWTLAHPEIAKQPVKAKIVPWRQARNDDVFSR
jgi:hypothetical protein